MSFKKILINIGISIGIGTLTFLGFFFISRSRSDRRGINLIMESLTESKVEIKLLKQDSENLTSDLKATQAQVNQLQIDQAVLKLNYSLQSTSYEKLKKRVDLIWLDRVGFGLLGFGTGIGINELAHKLGGN